MYRLCGIKNVILKFLDNMVKEWEESIKYDEFCKMVRICSIVVWKDVERWYYNWREVDNKWL